MNSVNAKISLALWQVIFLILTVIGGSVTDESKKC
jgi:hypothetical protein